MNAQLTNLVQHLLQTNRQTITPDKVNMLGYMEAYSFVAMFNDATYSCIEAVGISPAYLLSRRYGIWSSHAHSQYFATVYAGQTVNIFSRFLGYSRKRLHLMHYMTVDGSHHVVGTYEQIVVSINCQTQCTNMWSDSIMQKIVGYVTAHQALPLTTPTCGILHPF